MLPFSSSFSLVLHWLKETQEGGGGGCGSSTVKRHRVPSRGRAHIRVFAPVVAINTAVGQRSDGDGQGWVLLHEGAEEGEAGGFGLSIAPLVRAEPNGSSGVHRIQEHQASESWKVGSGSGEEKGVGDADGKAAAP